MARAGAELLVRIGERCTNSLPPSSQTRRTQDCCSLGCKAWKSGWQEELYCWRKEYLRSVLQRTCTKSACAAPKRIRQSSDNSQKEVTLATDISRTSLAVNGQSIFGRIPPRLPLLHRHELDQELALYTSRKHTSKSHGTTPMLNKLKYVPDLTRLQNSPDMSSLQRRACYKCGNVGHYAGQ